MRVGPLEREISISVPIGDSRENLGLLKDLAQGYLQRLCIELGMEVSDIETIHEPENRHIIAVGRVLVFDFFDDEEEEAPHDDVLVFGPEEW